MRSSEGSSQISLASERPDRVALIERFDRAMARRIYAGADFFLMPSRFEPCGLNQIYSLKYGTVPIVRATGGLDDTIENYDPIAGAGNGFKFTPYTAPALIRAAAIRYGLATSRISTFGPAIVTTSGPSGLAIVTLPWCRRAAGASRRHDRRGVRSR